METLLASAVYYGCLLGIGFTLGHYTVTIPVQIALKLLGIGTVEE
jgi:hypothetical protein